MGRRAQSICRNWQIRCLVRVAHCQRLGHLQSGLEHWLEPLSAVHFRWCSVCLGYTSLRREGFVAESRKPDTHLATVARRHVFFGASKLSSSPLLCAVL